MGGRRQQTATKTTIPQGLCGLVLSLANGQIDEKAVRSVIGNRVAKRLEDVAIEFGVSPATLRQSWRQVGMPGEAGKWPLAEILIWRIGYQKELSKRRGGLSDVSDRDLDRRLKEADVEKAEAQARKLNAEVEERIGSLISLEEVTEATSAAFAFAGRRMAQIPDKLAPRMSEELAREMVPAWRHEIDLVLQALAESLPGDVMHGGDE